MAEFKITKGDRQTLPFRVTDVDNLSGYTFIFTLAAEDDGVPFITKSSGGINEIITDIALKNVDVNFEVADFDYVNSNIEPGEYHYHLIAIFNDGLMGDYPRTIDKGKVIVSDSQYYKHQ
jgi:hypothetical protein